MPEMNDSDSWLSKTSLTFKIGSVVKKLWLMEVGEFSENPENFLQNGFFFGKKNICKGKMSFIFKQQFISSISYDSG